MTDEIFDTENNELSLSHETQEHEEFPGLDEVENVLEEDLEED